MEDAKAQLDYGNTADERAGLIVLRLRPMWTIQGLGFRVQGLGV